MNAYPTRPQRLDFAEDSFNPAVDPVRKGSTFIRTINVEGIDLTGHEIQMSVKESYTSDPILFFDSAETDIEKERIEITVYDDFSTIQLIIPHTVTELLDAGDGQCKPRRKKYHYDMETVTPSLEVYAILEGDFFIVDELTTEETSGVVTI